MPTTVPALAGKGQHEEGAPAPQFMSTCRHQRLTTERDDVAAVLMHKLPRHRLLHDLLHLLKRGLVRENVEFQP